MALNSFLRRASSTVLPLAIRTVGSPRTYHRLISTVEKSSLCHQLNLHNFAPFFRFSTAVRGNPTSDSDLVEIIHKEIDDAEIPDDNVMETVPEGFPFEIDDKPGERIVLLTRKFGKETIKVTVEMPNQTEEEEEGEGEEEGDENEEKESGSCLPLVVSIMKGNGQCLQFGVTAFADEIAIDSLSIKQSEDSEDELAYEGPEFDDLDQGLQESLQKFLEVRGINSTTARFLHDYMNNKDDKEYLAWLKNLEKFVSE